MFLSTTPQAETITTSLRCFTFNSSIRQLTENQSIHSLNHFSTNVCLSPSSLFLNICIFSSLFMIINYIHLCFKLLEWPKKKLFRAFRKLLSLFSDIFRLKTFISLWAHHKMKINFKRIKLNIITSALYRNMSS